MLNILLGVLLVVQSPPAAQRRSDTRTWYQAYADAQANIAKRNWQVALDDLDVAARRGAPKPGRNVLFYGDVYRDYNPDYYQGLAYLNLQRYEEANQAFGRVTRGQLIATRDTLDAEFTRQSPLVKDSLQKLSAEARSVAAGPPSIAQPNQTQGPPNVAQAAQSVAGPIRPSADGAVAAGLSPEAPSPDKATARPQDSQQALASPEQQKLADAQRARPPALSGPSTTTKVLPSGAVQAPDRGGALPGASDERVGTLKFFQGDYQTAASSLAGVTSSAAYVSGVSTRAYFYLACARAALVLTGGAPKRALLEARAQLALARDTGQFAADKRLISPRIMQELGVLQ